MLFMNKIAEKYFHECKCLNKKTTEYDIEN